MSRDSRPTAVRSYVLRPLWWLPLAFGSGLLMFVAGWTAARAADESFDNGFELQARVHRDYGGGQTVPLTYDNPLSGETYAEAIRWGAVPAPQPGARVAIEVDRADPRDVVLAGDRYPGDSIWYAGIPTMVIVVVFVVRAFGAWRIQRLVTGRGPSFSMLATVSAASTRSHRTRLHLYPVDTAAGSSPLCSVALHTSHGLPVGGPAFVAEVKGAPRPFGRVAARVGESVLWPRGRCLSAASDQPLPAETSEPLTFRAIDSPEGAERSFPFLRLRVPLVAVAAGALVGSLVTVAAVQGWRSALALERDGVEVVSTVTESDPDDSSVGVAFRLPGDDEDRSARVPVDHPEDWDVDDQFLVVVDPSDPDQIRFLEEPYDALEPILWAWTPAVMALVWLVWSLRWRWLERRASRGPWYEVDAWVVGRNVVPSLGADVIDVAVTHPDASIASCIVRLPALWDAWWPPTGMRAGVRRVALSGGTGPGEAVALQFDGRIVPGFGPAQAPGPATQQRPRPSGARTGTDSPSDLDAPPPEAMDSVPNASIPLSWHRIGLAAPRIQPHPGCLRLFVPHYFGARAWTLETAGCAVAYLGARPMARRFADEAAALGLRLPYLKTTHEWAAPTLALLFDIARTVPPVQLPVFLDARSEIGFVETRKRAAKVHGVLLRAKDGAGAAAGLAHLGIPRVTPDAWLDGRRRDRARSRT